MLSSCRVVVGSPAVRACAPYAESGWPHQAKPGSRRQPQLRVQLARHNSSSDNCLVRMRPRFPGGALRLLAAGGVCRCRGWEARPATPRGKPSPWGLSSSLEEEERGRVAPEMPRPGQGGRGAPAERAGAGTTGLQQIDEEGVGGPLLDSLFVTPLGGPCTPGHQARCTDRIERAAHRLARPGGTAAGAPAGPVCDAAHAAGCRCAWQQLCAVLLLAEAALRVSKVSPSHALLCAPVAGCGDVSSGCGRRVGGQLWLVVGEGPSRVTSQTPEHY